MISKYVVVIVLTLTLVVLQACNKAVEPEEPCNFVQNSLQQRISWGDDTPVEMMIHESVPQEQWQTIRDSAKAWNDLVGREVIRITMTGVGGPAKPQKDGYSIIYNLSEWEESKTREQARTSVYWQGSQISEADIRLNNVNFEFSVTELVELDKVDLFSLMVHEMGHVLGLSHIEEKGSVMNSELAKGEDRKLIAGSADFNSVSCEY